LEKVADFFVTLEISIKSGEDSIITLSLVIHGVRLKRNLPKSTLALKGRVKLTKPSILIVPD
jgi:hypothetical protein